MIEAKQKKKKNTVCDAQLPNDCVKDTVIDNDNVNNTNNILQYDSENKIM